MSSERTGGCACGAIRFSVSTPLMGVGVCHCKDCQKASGGPPNYVALVPEGGLSVSQGEAQMYRSQADSGATASRAFCASCGSPLWSDIPGMPFTAVKLGALDDSSDLTPSLHLYASSAPSWHQFHDGLPVFPKMPPPPES